jgi:hypothetical protein
VASTATVAQTIPASRIYAIREIARRAGVDETFFRSWQFAIEDSWMVVRLGPSEGNKIRIPESPAGDGGASLPIVGGAARATWAFSPHQNLSHWIPDFVIPFVTKGNERLPIFQALDSDTVDFHYDLPTATLLTLSRREEENETVQRDAHGRFPAAASVAARCDFLHRPIVDEYGFAMEQALRFLIPSWQPPRREFKAKLSHDIDDVGIPFELRTSIGHLLARRNLPAAARDFISLVSAENPAFLSLVERLVLLSCECGLDSAIYWKASDRGPFDSGYDPRNAKIRKVIG